MSQFTDIIAKSFTSEEVDTLRDEYEMGVGDIDAINLVTPEDPRDRLAHLLNVAGDALEDALEAVNLAYAELYEDWMEGEDYAHDEDGDDA